MVVFTEMFLTGYPVEDLALRTSFVEASISAVEEAARRLEAAGLGELPVVVGYVDRARLTPRVGQPEGAPLDAAALLHRGRVVVRTAKHHLPNYGVFDEYRYFVRGDRLPIFRLPTASRRGDRDLRGPLAGGRPRHGGAEAGAACWWCRTPRRTSGGRTTCGGAVARRAREAGCALAYVNQVGGQDELVFDGDSILVVSPPASSSRARPRSRNCCVTDLELPEARSGGSESSRWTPGTTA